MFYKISKTNNTGEDNATQVKTEGGEEIELGSVIISHDIDDDEGIEETRQHLQGDSVHPGIAFYGNIQIKLTFYFSTNDSAQLINPIAQRHWRSFARERRGV